MPAVSDHPYSSQISGSTDSTSDEDDDFIPPITATQVFS